jgi:hypothetical protein
MIDVHGSEFTPPTRSTRNHQSREWPLLTGVHTLGRRRSASCGSTPKIIDAMPQQPLVEKILAHRNPHPRRRRKSRLRASRSGAVLAS